MAADIDFLENGQFAKYDYANEAVNFTGAGEWMLVFNEVKIYRDHETDCDFAFKKDDYAAYVYSPIDGTDYTQANARDYTGVTSGPDPYEPDSTLDPFKILTYHGPKMMPDGTTAVPRLMKTNVGDIFTTNCVNEETLAVGDTLVVGDDGYLTKTAGSNAGTMQWQVSKVYTLADNQKAVKIIRVA